MPAGEQPYSAVAEVGGIRMGLVTGGGRLLRLHFLVEDVERDPADRAAERALQQLMRYMDDPEWRFDLPLGAAVTDFQGKVRGALCAIPAGTTRTYGSLARRLRTAPRAVGVACRLNPLPIVVPCHRVVTAHGLGGYVGSARPDAWLAIKRRLLTHEGAL